MQKGLIFLVDDDGFDLNMAKMFLEEELGHEVFTFSSPENVLEMLKQVLPNIVITDYEMPAMTGEELSEKIKEISREIGIIMWSGKIKDDLPEKVLKNVDCFVEKFELGSSQKIIDAIGIFLG